jgi:surface polysaccharide O-acyltransferase-like enzyme
MKKLLSINLMNKYLSNKIKSLSFLMMVFVVYLHSYNLPLLKELGIYVGRFSYNAFFQLFISTGIVRIAVPFFFLISGYLFFVSINNYTISEFSDKFLKRFRSLVIPYLIWSLYGIILYYILQSTPGINSFFENKLLKDYTIVEITSIIFINPIPYQLWFIRDLVVLILFSPIISYFLRINKVLLLLFLAFLWVFKLENQTEMEALLFFTVGSFLGINKFKTINFSDKIAINFIFLWLLMLIVKTSFILFNFTFNEYMDLNKWEEYFWILRIFDKLVILFGILSFWIFYDYIIKNKTISSIMTHLAFNYGIFLYLLHEPLLTMVKIGFFYLLGVSEFSSFFIFWIAPIIVIAVSIISAYIISKKTPRLYSIVSGGR